MIIRLLRKIIDFYLYSSIHIALGAALSVLLCYATFIHIPTSDYTFFVFASTLFIYCSHRIVGIQKVKAFENEGRFAIIKKFRLHIFLYAIIGGIASAYLFYRLDLKLQLYLILPGIISVLYVLPLFSKKKRLRDFNNIKIYLIAIIWGLIIGLIPYIEVVGNLDGTGILYFLEKTFFIFAITLPFDIRDLDIDKSIQVSTIPSKIGKNKSYNLAYVILGVCMLIVIVLYFLNVYSLPLMIGLILGYIITGALIKLSRDKDDDYFYSGLLDASIIIVALLGIVMSGILDLVF